MQSETIACDWRFQLLKDFCPQNNNWILYLNYHDIVNHAERQIQTFENGNLKSIDSKKIGELGHIYFNFMTGERLTALVATRTGDVILIDNACEVEIPQNNTSNVNKKSDGEEVINLNNDTSLPKIKGVKSTLTYLTSVSDLASRQLFGRSYQKTLGLFKWWEKCVDVDTISSKDKKLQLPLLLLRNSLSSDNDNSNILEILTNNSHSSKFDLTGVISISTETLEQLPIMDNVKHIVLDQNCQISSFKWLSRFPKLSILELHQCQQVNNSHLTEVCQNASGLEAVILDHCCSLNIRCFLPLLNLTRLRLIKVAYPNFSCQPCEKEVYISKREWSDHNSYSLEQLEIDSTEMTLDVLDYLLKSCPNVKTVSVSEETLRNVSKNAMFDETNKREEDVLNFHQANDPCRGIRASRPIHFKNMYKDKFSMPFSKSMLAKIQAEGGIIALPSALQ